MFAQQIFDVTELIQSNLSLLAYSLDLILKSLFLLSIAKYFESERSPFFSNTQKYRLWLTVLLLIGLMPVGSIVFRVFPSGLGSLPNLQLLTILIPTELAGSASEANTNSLLATQSLMGIYFLGVLWHLSRLTLSLHQINKIRRCANFEVPASTREILQSLRSQLGISRPIALGVSDLCTSPMTFGTMKPLIIFPSADYFEDPALLKNVLLHELWHIRRLDHPSYLLCYVTCALNWFNPVIWKSLKHLELAAEYACDDGVLKQHGEPMIFASQLLKIAKWGLNCEQYSTAYRAVLVRGQLSMRINNILHSNSTPRIGKTYSCVTPILLLCLCFVVTSTGKMFALESEAKYASEDLRVIYQEVPTYPDLALEKGITGFAQFSFRVNKDGKIEPKTIVLKRAEPSQLFKQPSIEALNKFVFSPRKVNGKRVSTSGVSYTFEYDIRI